MNCKKQGFRKHTDIPIHCSLCCVLLTVISHTTTGRRGNMWCFHPAVTHWSMGAQKMKSPCPLPPCACLPKSASQQPQAYTQLQKTFSLAIIVFSSNWQLFGKKIKGNCNVVSFWRWTIISASAANLWLVEIPKSALPCHANMVTSEVKQQMAQIKHGCALTIKLQLLYEFNIWVFLSDEWGMGIV